MDIDEQPQCLPQNTSTPAKRLREEQATNTPVRKPRQETPSQRLREDTPRRPRKSEGRTRKQQSRCGPYKTDYESFYDLGEGWETKATRLARLETQLASPQRKAPEAAATPMRDVPLQHSATPSSRFKVPFGIPESGRSRRLVACTPVRPLLDDDAIDAQVLSALKAAAGISQHTFPLATIDEVSSDPTFDARLRLRQPLRLCRSSPRH